MAMGRARGPFTGKKLDKGTLKRLLKILFTEYKGIVTAFFVTLLISSVCASINGIFLNKVYKTLNQYVAPFLDSTKAVTITASKAWSNIVLILTILLGIYVIGLIANFIFNNE